MAAARHTAAGAAAARAARAPRGAETLVCRGKSHRAPLLLVPAAAPALQSFERLEFLGDSVLGLTCRTLLMERRPGSDEVRRGAQLGWAACSAPRPACPPTALGSQLDSAERRSLLHGSQPADRPPLPHAVFAPPAPARAR